MTNLSGTNLHNGAAVGPQGEGKESPSTFPKYPAYKDSGVEWLGEVPEGWILARGDAYLRSQAKVVSADYLGGKEVFHYSIPAVQATGDGQLEDGDEIDSSKLLVEQPQVLISKLNPRKNTVCLAGPREVVTVCSGEFVPLQSDCMDLKWVYYLVSSENFKKRLESLVESATRSHQRVNPSDILKFRGAFPLLAEQTQIARFLDHETARIDALIEEQQRLIELLKEKRQAVISHAVTKGLDPKVPMKDSGVEWLGEVPAHWQVKRLKHLVPSITVGIVVEPSKYYVDDGVPALRSLNVKPGAVVTENLVYLSEESNELHAKSKIFEGDIVAVRSGQPGTAAIVPKEFNGANCIDLIVIRKPLQGCSTFIFWYLNSDAALKQFSEGSSGAIQQHFNIAAASEMIFAWPPASEQLEINSHLDRACHQLDRLISVAGESKSLL
ncbi:restriction endonuclease subunit S, partial [Pseudomonas aeruginosa]|nr:restriction endonuclease subunit S [Pseudomonas aeruginosa]EKW6759661.1 restriction endonuclease subunit S [Pseudomonas aeruginosa]EKY2868539.1 restriction endonuclease subunit S [Pseudomonas aeruginosa]